DAPVQGAPGLANRGRRGRVALARHQGRAHGRTGGLVNMNLKMSAVVAAVGLTVAGCGSSSSSSAPDVSGGTASDKATLFRSANMAPVWDKVKAKTGAGFQGSVLKVEPRDIKLIAQGASGTEIVTVDNK